MFELFSTEQSIIIALIFIWGGFVRSGLGFGGAVLSLPFLILVFDQPLFFLPIICIHLLFFSAITILPPYIRQALSKHTTDSNIQSNIDWYYLNRCLAIIIIPKLIGVFGLLNLPNHILSICIFFIVAIYAISYIRNKPFTSKNRYCDVIFLVIGGYVSGTSLIGAPLIIAVIAKYIDKRDFRNTLFVLWFILVTIKLSTFIYWGIDLQLKQQIWLLPCAGIGHCFGLYWHEKLIHSDQKIFYRLLGYTLLLVSILGIVNNL